MRLFDRLLQNAGFRLFEWTMTIAMLCLGVHLVLWPDAIARSAFRILLEFVSVDLLTVAYLVAGSIRVAALVTNGHSPVLGPALRAVGSLVGACVWLQMDYALFRLMDTGSPPSPGLPLYSSLVMAELVSTYRAAADVRSSAGR